MLTPVLGLLSSIAFTISGRLSTDTLLRSAANEWPIDPVTLDALISSLHAAFGLIMTSALIVAIAQTYVSLAWSRRVFGPEVPFLNHLKRLNEGDYTSRVHLRQGDEFQDIATELNRLAEKLGGAR